MPQAPHQCPGCAVVVNHRRGFHVGEPVMVRMVTITLVHPEALSTPHAVQWWWATIMAHRMPGTRLEGVPRELDGVVRVP